MEADGDIHIALEDATGNNLGTVSAEIPVGPKWCEIRTPTITPSDVSDHYPVTCDIAIQK